GTSGPSGPAVHPGPPHELPRTPSPGRAAARRHARQPLRRLRQGAATGPLADRDRGRHPSAPTDRRLYRQPSAGAAGQGALPRATATLCRHPAGPVLRPLPGGQLGGLLVRAARPLYPAGLSGAGERARTAGQTGDDRTTHGRSGLAGQLPRIRRAGAGAGRHAPAPVPPGRVGRRPGGAGAVVRTAPRGLPHLLPTTAGLRPTRSVTHAPTRPPGLLSRARPWRSSPARARRRFPASPSRWRPGAAFPAPRAPRARRT